MPTYCYRCQACRHEWEHAQRISDDALRFCPVCKQPFATRVPPPEPPPVHFKGGGWTLKSTAGDDPGKRKAGGWE